MEKIIGVRVGEKYKKVEPFEIVMPDGTSSHVAHESDSTDLLNRGHVLEREDGVMQRMKEHARETSNSWDEKLRIANQYDGSKIRSDEAHTYRVGNEHAKPAAHALNTQLAFACRNDVLEPGMAIHSTVCYSYDGPYVDTVGPTGVDKGGYKSADYSIASESAYQPAEYKSVYES